MEIETTLKEQWQEIKQSDKPMRIRNAAEKLGVSEVELLATEIGEGSVTRLKSEFNEILIQIESLGYVMALTRNDEVVHERKGVYLNGSFGPHASLFVGADIDLRIFLNSWSSVFAVQSESGNTIRRSLQFFNAEGVAMHKIFLTPKSDTAAYLKLVSDFTSANQEHIENVAAASVKERKRSELTQDELTAFREGWLNMKDTHHFFGLLNKYELDRVAALENAPEGNYAVEVSNSVVREICNRAVQTEVPIMVFVGNSGIIQIHTGPIKNLLDQGTWFNIMDPDFNLHLDESRISRSFIVRKPTEDGLVTSVEVFNEKGDLIVTLFGKRKPGNPELLGWRDIVKEVEGELAING
jgi:putative hemin transport protein